MASRPNTIGLIPLDDNKFNRCKSAIKYFDYALAGVPCICSDVVPYSPIIESNQTGLLCDNTRDAWVAAVRSLAENPQRRAEVASRALARVAQEHNLNASARAWQQMLSAVPFPDADAEFAALEEFNDPYFRTSKQLARGTIRHLMQPASYTSAWRIFRKSGLRGLRDKWKLVF